MNVEQQLTAVLEANATVAALVTTAGVARIYPLLMPQGVTLPAISYQRVATIPHDDLELAQNHERVRVQIDCWDDDYAGAKALAAAVRTALQVTPVFGQLLMELDDYDSEEKLFRVTQDFNIWN